MSESTPVVEIIDAVAQKTVLTTLRSMKGHFCVRELLEIAERYPEILEVEVAELFPAPVEGPPKKAGTPSKPTKPAKGKTKLVVKEPAKKEAPSRVSPKTTTADQRKWLRDAIVRILAASPKPMRLKVMRDNHPEVFGTFPYSAIRRVMGEMASEGVISYTGRTSYRYYSIAKPDIAPEGVVTEVWEGMSDLLKVVSTAYTKGFSKEEIMKHTGRSRASVNRCIQTVRERLGVSTNEEMADLLRPLVS